MVLLFFALDLRNLSPPLLEEVKQCLLQLANLYTVSDCTSRRRDSESVIEDRIGLCYLQQSANCSYEEYPQQLKIAYSPRGRSFSLRDFHYAVKHLPYDSHLPPFVDDFGSSLLQDVDFSSILSDEVLESTGNKDIERKIILISSYTVWNVDSKARKILLDAADRCVSVEFVFLEQKSSQLSDLSEKMNKFRQQICDLENCSFNAYIPDAGIFNGLVKRWLRELTDTTEEILDALFVFENNIAGSTNQLSCKLCNCVNRMMDGFSPCKDHTNGCTLMEGLSRDFTKPDRELDNVDIDFMKAGKHTLTVGESWRSWTNLRQVTSVVLFNVIERTSLASLNEGVVVGRPYIVIPSVGQEDAAAEENDKSQMNDRLLHGLRRALYALNQGLVCWSFCNVETMKVTAFYHYYVLQPSDNGPMLLRRLAGAEEILPLPDVNLSDSSADEEVVNSIQLFLREVELKEYNPVLHRSGFHEKINQLVQESSQSGWVISAAAATTESDSITHETSAVPTQCTKASDNAATRRVNFPILQTDEAEKGVSRLTQEWEQLVVGNIPSIDPPPTPTNPQLNEPPKTSPLASQKPVDTRTSRILERLGNPNQMKTKTTSPTVVITGIASPSDGKTESNPSPGLNAEVQHQGLAGTSEPMKSKVNDIGIGIGVGIGSTSDRKTENHPSSGLRADVQSQGLVATSQLMKPKVNGIGIGSTSDGETVNRPSGLNAAVDRAVVSASQLMRPNFQRLKRKFRSVKTFTYEALQNIVRFINGISALLLAILPGKTNILEGVHGWELRPTFRGPRLPRWMGNGVSSFNQLIHELSMQPDGSSSDISSGEEDNDGYASPSSFKSHSSRFSRASSTIECEKQWTLTGFILSWILFPLKLLLGLPFRLYSLLFSRGKRAPLMRHSQHPYTPHTPRTPRRLQNLRDHFVHRTTDRRRGVIEDLHLGTEICIEAVFDAVNKATHLLFSPSEAFRSLCAWAFPYRSVTNSADSIPTEDSEETVSTTTLGKNDPTPAERKMTFHPLNTDGRTCQDVITELGYPYEAIHVITDDGYILLLERIPRRDSRKAVYLQHGVLDSSMGWVSNGVVGSPAFAAYDQGYDVFLGNFRGLVSREHVDKNISSRQYWRYSINEHGTKDIPAMIEKIHEVKISELKLRHPDIDEQNCDDEQQPYNLCAISHSLGGAGIVMYVVTQLIEQKPHRLSRLVLLSPAGFHDDSTFAFTIAEHVFFLLAPILVKIVPAFYVPTRFFRMLLNKLARDFHNYPAVGGLVQTLMSYIVGGDSSNWVGVLGLPHYNMNDMPGVSFYVALHLAQMKRTGKFRMFDFGSPDANMQVYGSPEPLDLGEFFDLIDIPVDLVAGRKDNVIRPSMVKKYYHLMEEAGVEVSYNEYEYAHLDFTFSHREELLAYVMSRLRLVKSTPKEQLSSKSEKRSETDQDAPKSSDM